MPDRALIAVPGRPGFTSLLWWFQGAGSDVSGYRFLLDDAALPPERYKVFSLSRLVTVASGGDIAERTFVVVTLHEAGPPGAHFSLVVQDAHGQQSNVARSRLLPQGPASLVVVAASCFSAFDSTMTADGALPKEFADPAPPPHFKLLTGDQIYLDLARHSIPRLRIRDPWENYFDQWRSDNFLAFMACGANLCMADDHEFWNNFPSATRLAHIFDWAFKVPPAEGVQAMREAYALYQGALNFDPDELAKLPAGTLQAPVPYTFEFPGSSAPASFRSRFAIMVLDTRTQRTFANDGKPLHVTSQDWLEAALAWIGGRDAPGILVTSQSMLDADGHTEADMANFADDFGALWNELMTCKHTLLLLTGDIHWSRVQMVKDTSREARHYELVSSALSRIDFGSDFESFKKTTGAIKWNSGCAEYVRQADAGERQNFCILRFSDGAAGNLRIDAEWWVIGDDGNRRLVNIYPGGFDFLPTHTIYSASILLA